MAAICLWIAVSSRKIRTVFILCKRISIFKKASQAGASEKFLHSRSGYLPLESRLKHGRRNGFYIRNAVIYLWKAFSSRGIGTIFTLGKRLSICGKTSQAGVSEYVLHLRSGYLLWKGRRLSIYGKSSQPIQSCLRSGLLWFNWWVFFAPEFQWCYL